AHGLGDAPGEHDRQRDRDRARERPQQAEPPEAERPGRGQRDGVFDHQGAPRPAALRFRTQRRRHHRGHGVLPVREVPRPAFRQYGRHRQVRHTERHPGDSAHGGLRMKGFVITLDAVIAISFFLLAIIIITSQLYQPRSPNDLYLKELTLDTITVLVKTGGIDQAIEGNISSVQEVLQATPDLACMGITIYNSTGDVVASTVKSGCNYTVGLDMQAAAASERFNQENFMVQSESWFKAGSDWDA